MSNKHTLIGQHIVACVLHIKVHSYTQGIIEAGDGVLNEYISIVHAHLGVVDQELLYMFEALGTETAHHEPSLK